MKRIFAMLIACLLVFSSVMVCFAADEIITVKNAGYENGTLTFTVANNTNTVITDSVVLLAMKAS